MNKIFVEFFSEEALENVMVLLKYQPKQIIYIGTKQNMITAKINSLTTFAKKVSPATKLTFREVARDNLEEMISAIENISDENPDAVFELTGGNELILIAFGVVSTKRKLHTLRIDPYTGMEVEFTDQGPKCSNAPICMSVADNMILHGGRLTGKTGNYSTWKFTEDFRADIRNIWEIAKKLRHRWNNYLSTIEEVIKYSPCDEQKVYTVSKAKLGDAIVVFEELNKIGCLPDYEDRGKSIRFAFKNEQIRHAVTKTGNILELHVYEIATRPGSIFHDAIIGAMIDWDGNAKPVTYNGTGYETINEIDVILMRNVIPTFISCKSGKAGSLALHELQTVTSRFGGKYAKKALIMSVPCDSSVNGASFFKQRAKDMHIWVIDNIYDMPDDVLIRKLKKIQETD